MRIVAFVFAVAISAVGAAGIVAPARLVEVAQLFVASGSFGFYILAVVRIAFGLTLISVAAVSRAPRALKVLGYVIVILGITTALTGLVATGPAQSTIGGWTRQGTGVVRLTAVLVLALGAFIAYACAPVRRASV